MYSTSKDTKYQSVYVISEDKDECVIATEVSRRARRQGSPCCLHAELTPVLSVGPSRCSVEVIWQNSRFS